MILIVEAGQNIRIAYDLNDISFVTVWTLDGIFICRVTAFVQQGTTNTDIYEDLKPFAVS